MTEANNSTHWVLAGALLLIGVFVIVALVMVNSQAQDIASDADVNNSAPVVVDSTLDNNNVHPSHVNFYGGGTINDLAPGGTINRWVVGQVSDANGAIDITDNGGVSLVAFEDSQTTNVCSDNGGYTCIVVASCNIVNVSGNTADYDCPVVLPSFMMSTDGNGEGLEGHVWRFEVKVSDGTASTTLNTLTKEVATTAAIQHVGSVDFNTAFGGNFTVGDATATGTNVDVTVNQAGNDNLDLDIFLDDVDNDAAGPNVNGDGVMACSQLGGIAASQLKYSLTDQDWGGATSNFVMGVATNPTDLAADISYETAQSGGGSTSDIVSFNIQIPSGVKGACTENIAIVTVPE